MKSYEDLARECMTVDGAIDLMKMDQMPTVGGKCDVLSGPCACGATHSIEERKSEAWRLNEYGRELLAQTQGKPYGRRAAILATQKKKAARGENGK